jgi:hypothetical protein
MRSFFSAAAAATQAQSADKDVEVVDPPSDSSLLRVTKFGIKIFCTTNVSALKQAIRNEQEPVFDRAPADTRVLWNVSVPADGLLRHDHRSPDLAKDQSFRSQ